jgi:hypothetical protein
MTSGRRRLSRREESQSDITYITTPHTIATRAANHGAIGWPKATVRATTDAGGTRRSPMVKKETV